MRERIMKYNMEERAVVADGNCQFRSLADQVHKDQNLHEAVREQVVRWLQTNENHHVDDGSSRLEDFLDRDLFPSWKDYCTYMKRNGSWGDHMTLMAAAEIFNSEIWIISSVKFSPGIEPIINIVPTKKPAKRTIRLAHYHELHYNSLHPKIKPM